ncbi:MAG TPA: SRPBCC family protein [Steroidobacteraceae bacterium]|jgi:uncharacterized protein YndB with AHSA1/START domain
MTARAPVHDTFALERRLAFAPQTVFAAWSSVEAKSRWFVGPTGWELEHRELDFQVGGREVLTGRRSDGKVSHFDSRYYEIVPDQRIVYVYDMYTDDIRLSLSLVTVEFRAIVERTRMIEGTRMVEGTRLVVTEQGVFFGDKQDARNREHGTGILLNQLERALAG